MSQTLASASQNVYDGKDMVSSGELKKVGSIKLGSLFKLRLPERWSWNGVAAIVKSGPHGALVFFFAFHIQIQKS